MEMHNVIIENMFAVCGMNCTVCYRHIGTKERGSLCGGCLSGDENKPKSCRMCKIKDCARGKENAYCYDCEQFPCKRIKNLERVYKKKYETSLIKNSETARALGIEAFLREDIKRWTCKECGGGFSIHDGFCSECGNIER